MKVDILALIMMLKEMVLIMIYLVNRNYHLFVNMDVLKLLSFFQLQYAISDRG